MQIETDLPWEVSVQLAPVGDTYQLVALCLRPRRGEEAEDTPAPITPTALRGIPIPYIRREARRLLDGRVEAGEEAWDRPAQLSTEKQLYLVAKIYEAEMSRVLPTGTHPAPTKAVQRYFNISRAKALRLVRQARDGRYLAARKGAGRPTTFDETDDER